MGRLGFGLRSWTTGAQGAERRASESSDSRELAERDADDLGNHRARAIYCVEHVRQHHVHAIRLAIHTFQNVRGRFVQLNPVRTQPVCQSGKVRRTVSILGPTFERSSFVSFTSGNTFVRSSSICSWASFNALRAVINMVSKTSACISTAAPVQATKMIMSVSLFTFVTEMK